ncbi:polycystin-1-like protein 2 [Glandiceps talaboti]
MDAIKDRPIAGSNVHCASRPRDIVTSDATIVCECNHLTKFVAADIIVPVNTIDFSTVFSKDITDNSVVLLTISAFFIIYILIVMWMRRKDKHDLIEWLSPSLFGNKTEDNYLYQISVYTGLRPNAGTTGDVSFEITGEQGQSGVKFLKDKERIVKLSTGSVRTFIMSVPKCLGPLLYIHIWLNITKGKLVDGWFLERIEVLDLHKKHKFHFTCYKWFAIEKSSSTLRQVLPVCSKPQLTKFVHLMSSHGRDKMTDDYLWGSVVNRQIPSSFTRVERLSCCLTAMFLTMLANAMFYNSDDRVQSTKIIKLGPIEIPLGMIYTGLTSCLVTIPVSIIIVYLFSKSKPYRRVKRRHGSATILSTADNLSDIDDKNVPLPWWCKWIAWFLVAICVLLSAFFVVLYSLQWGPDVSKEWLTSQLSSLFLSSLVIDPLKAILIAFVLTVKFKLLKEPTKAEPNSSDERGIKQSIQFDSIKVEDTCKLKDTGDFASPPTPKEIKSARQLYIKHMKLMKTIKDMIFWTLFLVVTVLITQVYRSPTHYYSNKAMYQTIGRREALQCRDVSCILEWINRRAIYFDKEIMTTDMSYVVSNITLRQQRIATDLCSDKPVLKAIHEKCIYHGEMDKGAYGMGWTTSQADSVTNFTYSPWVHSSHRHNHLKYTLPVWAPSGKRYNAEGFIAPLGKDGRTARDILDNLIDNGWVDRYTRVLILEFTTYNPNANLLSAVTFLAECHSTSIISTMIEVSTVVLMDPFQAKNDAVFPVICHALFSILTLYLLFRYMSDAGVCGCKVAWNFWNAWYLTGSALGMISTAMLILRLVVMKWVLQELSHCEDCYGSVRYLTFIDDIHTIVLALVSFVSIIGLLSVFSLNRTTSVLGICIGIAVRRLLLFTPLFFIIFFAYAQLFYFLIAPTLGYASLYDTMTQLLFLPLTSTHHSEYADSVVAQIMISTLLYLKNCIYVVLVMSIVNTAFKEAHLQPGLMGERYDTYDNLLNKICHWFRNSWIYRHYISHRKRDTSRKVFKRKRIRRIRKIPRNVSAFNNLEERLKVIEDRVDKMK